jgi:hypothetical protein
MEKYGRSNKKINTELLYITISSSLQKKVFTINIFFFCKFKKAPYGRFFLVLSYLYITLYVVSLYYIPRATVLSED